MGPDSTSQQPSQDAKQRSASSTSLKWGSDGELSPVDLQTVLERLTNPISPSAIRGRAPGVARGVFGRQAQNRRMELDHALLRH